MTIERIEVHIDRLVVDGGAHVDAATVATTLERELGRIVGASAANEPHAMHTGGDAALRATANAIVQRIRAVGGFGTTQGSDS